MPNLYVFRAWKGCKNKTSFTEQLRKWAPCISKNGYLAILLESEPHDLIGETSLISKVGHHGMKHREKLVIFTYLLASPVLNYCCWRWCCHQKKKRQEIRRGQIFRRREQQDAVTFSSSSYEEEGLHWENKGCGPDTEVCCSKVCKREKELYKRRKK